MIEACIFDIGGTLIRTEDALLEAVKDTLKTSRLPVPPDERIFIHFGIGHLNVLRNVVSEAYTGKDADSVTMRCYKSFEKEYPRKFLGKFRIMPGADRCLDELNARRVRTACQTGMGRSEARVLLKQFNILKYFPVLVAFEDADKPRPYPDAMYLTLKKLNITDKNKCLYIGDTVSDIKFARNAGVKMACVTTGPQKREMLEKEKPDYIINNLTELLNLV